MLMMSNNKIKTLLLPSLFLIVMTVLFCVPILSNKLFLGHDLLFHLSRINGLKDALLSGQIIPRIYPNSNLGFGYGSPMFYCDLFILPATFAYMAGCTLVISYKIELIIITFCTSLSIFLVSKRIIKNQIAPYLATIFYLFCTYHIVDVYARSALGETISFIFIPIVILGIYQIYYENSKSFLALSLGFTCLLLSHNISFYIMVILFALLSIINIKKLFNKSTILTLLKAILLALGLTAFFLLPMIEQLNSQEFYLSLNNRTNTLNKSAVAISELLSIEFRDGSYYHNSLNNVSINLGLFLTIAPLLIFLFFNKKRKNNIYQLLFTLTCLSYFLLFFMSTAFPFDRPSFLNIIQYPWRFLAPVSAFLSLSLAYSLSSLNINKKALNIGLCLISIVFLVRYESFILVILDTPSVMQNSLTYDEIIWEKIDDPFASRNYNLFELAGAEYLPYKIDMDYQAFGNNIRYRNLDKSTSTYEKTGISMVIHANEQYEDMDLLLPVTYYKGYQVYKYDIDGTMVKVPTTQNEYYGVVEFNVGKGTNLNYLLVYESTLIQKLSAILSLLSLIVLVILVARPLFKNGKRQDNCQNTQ